LIDGDDVADDDAVLGDDVVDVLVVGADVVDHLISKDTVVI
jgi:hypothetical protein